MWGSFAMLSKKWLPFLATQACSHSLEHHGSIEQLSGIRPSLFLMADGRPRLAFPGMANQNKSTGQLLLGQLAQNKVSGSYLQSRQGSASWLSVKCTSWSAHNFFQTIWHLWNPKFTPHYTLMSEMPR